MRISKAPDIRKQEILDTAMRLFYEKGYENTSMTDIAKEMQVVKGLCYRYFDSKQTLFEEAMNQYVQICCSNFIDVIHDQTKSFEERIDILGEIALHDDKSNRYHNFFHKPGNENLHKQLSMKICDYMYPHIKDEIIRMSNRYHLQIQSPSILSKFIVYGQIGLLSSNEHSMDTVIKQLKFYIHTLIQASSK